MRWHADFKSGVGVESSELSVSLGFLGQLGYDARITSQGDASHGFVVSKARPNIRMRALDGLLSAFIQPELAGTVALLDMQLGVHPLPEFNVELGQFIVPHSRGFMTPVPKLQFIDFGVVNDEFRAGRDVGLAINGTFLDGDIEYAVGLFDGNGLKGRFGTGYMGTGRLVFNPLGPVPYDETIGLSKPDGPFRFAIGLNGYGRVREIEDAPTQRDIVFGPELALVYRGLTVLAEGFRRHRSEADITTVAHGGYGQVGYFIVPKLLEVAGRVGALDLDIHAPGGTKAEYQGGVHVYPLGNHLKVQLRYAHRRSTPQPLGAEHRVSMQTQLQF